MDIISLSAVDLLPPAGLVLLLALLANRMDLRISRQLLFAAARTVIQLSLVGFVLKALFSHPQPIWILTAAAVMSLVAGNEIFRRQGHPFLGWPGFAIGAGPLVFSCALISAFALCAVIQVHPWYSPQYAIPLLGMLLGNTMSGTAIGMDRITRSAREHRDAIEARLLLGQDACAAIADLRRDAVRSGLIPIINSMSVVGIVSLPGMMTGQILSGTAPVEAVKYQILIMFLIGSATGFGTIISVRLAARRLFDDRHRLRLDRLRGAP